jgi:hypothetical protein
MTKENIEGNPVEKDYIISQLDTCPGGARDLMETCRHLDTGERAVHDTGYAKIVTQTDTLQHLLNKLKNNIPSGRLRAD